MTKIFLRSRIIFLITLINFIFGIASATDSSSEAFNEELREYAKTPDRITLAAVAKSEPSRDVVISYRQALMVAMQGHVKAAFLIAENKIANDAYVRSSMSWGENLFQPETANITTGN